MSFADTAWNGLKHLLGVEDGKGVAKALLEPIAIVAITFASTTAIAQPFYVPSGSMQPTLAIGDAFVAAKYPYGYSRYSVPFGLGPASPARLLQKMPARGDVVVFRLPRDPSQTYIKRVVGLPGDRIQMVSGRVWLNGKELALKADGQGKVESEDGSITDSPRYIETLPGGVTHPIYKWTWSGPLDDTPQFTVPAGHLFMMGDNRDNSLDSRVSADNGGVGFVPVENLVGRAEFVVGSYDFLNAHAVWSWVGELRLSRFFNGVN
ncbi:MAG TPA: signal peptidase I [Rhizomicrobium sp.]|jgi:signal peptidase I|nr:signal peptidase I [Rhizomicrobium sp.]